MSKAAEYSQTFESCAVNTSFSMNNSIGGTAVVSYNPNGSGKVLSVNNSVYSAVPLIGVTLPEGTTLSECKSISVSIYIPTSNNEQYANYKQMLIYINDDLVFKNTKSDGSNDYPKQANKDTWTTITIDCSKLSLSSSDKSLSSFNLGIGLNDDKIKYYIDNISIMYNLNTSVPILPEKGAFYTNTYRNLFKEAGYSQEKINQRISDLWQTYFCSSDASQRIYYESGSDMAYILDVNNNDVRTEGMSYGMMICLQMDKQAEFNKLWKWVKTYMQYTTGSEIEGCFSWQCNSDGSKKGNTPASDGEEYFIMDLLFAANRWGNGTGIYNYKAEADYIIENCFNKPMKSVNPYSSYTNIFNMEEKQVVFVPYASAAKFTDPSYHLPAFYELWAKWATSHNDDFLTLAAKSRELWATFSNATTGLMPDYANFDGSAHTGDGDHAKFLYDAWRCITNMAVDYSWFKPETDYVSLVDKMLNFFYTCNGGVSKYYSCYTLDGGTTNGNTDHSPGLVACNATGVLACDKVMAWDFIDDFMSTPIPSGRFRYYDGTLYFLNFLQVSGNYKIYKPSSTEAISKPVNPKINVSVVNDALSISGIDDGEYEIINLGNGTVMCSGQLSNNAIDCRALSSGVYALRLRPSSGDDIYINKFLK